MIRFVSGPQRRPSRASPEISHNRSRFPPRTFTSRWTIWAVASAANSQRIAGAVKGHNSPKPVAAAPSSSILDRATELTIAGVRPSHYAQIRVAAKPDGSITSWESKSWSSGGFGGGGMAPLPYVFTKIPNFRLNHSAVSINAGPQRAWRAPNHPQASFLTCSALEDLAAKLKMDPLEFFNKNIEYTARPEVYRSQLAKAAEIIEWKKNFVPRWEQKGNIRRSTGIGINTWGGAGHASQLAHHHQSRWLGRCRDRNAGSRSRNPYHHRSGCSRNMGPPI